MASSSFQYSRYRVVHCHFVKQYVRGVSLDEFQYSLYRVVHGHLMATDSYQTIVQVSVLALSSRSWPPSTAF